MRIKIANDSELT